MGHDNLMFHLSGPVVGDLLDVTVPLFKSMLTASQSSELRLKFFMLLSSLLLTSNNTLDSAGMLHPHLCGIVRYIFIPNLEWKAGRVACTLRTAAIACLWALLKGSLANPDSTVGCLEELITRTLALLDDESVKTRATSCKVLSLLMPRLRKVFNEDVNMLHVIYPYLLRRLDDEDDIVRVDAIAMFDAYARVFPENYDGSLFECHLRSIYKGLLMHMDDGDEVIRTAVLGKLTFRHFCSD